MHAPLQGAEDYWGACKEYHDNGGKYGIKLASEYSFSLVTLILRAGYRSNVEWRGLKLNPISLTVDTRANRYAKLVNGTDWLPYGSAADCFVARSLFGRVRDFDQFPLPSVKSLNRDAQKIMSTNLPRFLLVWNYWFPFAPPCFTILI